MDHEHEPQLASQPLHEAAFRGDFARTKELVELGEQVDQPGLAGRTPLFWAAEKGHKDVMEYLITKGANADISDNFGVTPLIRACCSGQLDVVRLLLKHGANLNAQTMSGHTPLHCACYFGRFGVVVHLILKGADVNVRNLYGQTPIHVAFSQNRTDEAVFLLDHNADRHVKDAAGVSASEYAPTRLKSRLEHDSKNELEKNVKKRSGRSKDRGDAIVRQAGMKGGVEIVAPVSKPSKKERMRLRKEGYVKDEKITSASPNLLLRDHRKRYTRQYEYDLEIDREDGDLQAAPKKESDFGAPKSASPVLQHPFSGLSAY